MSDNDTHKQVLQPYDGSEFVQSGSTIAPPSPSGLEVGIDRASCAPEVICHHGKTFDFLDEEKHQPQRRRHRRFLHILLFVWAIVVSLVVIGAAVGGAVGGTFAEKIHGSKVRQ